MSALDQLLRRVWATKGARLNAARRLEKRHLWSTRTVAFLSIYLASMSIYALASDSASGGAAASTFSIVASVLVLILSLIEGQEDYRVKAERLHQCAKDLLPLEIRLDNLKAQGTAALEVLSSIANDYVAVIDRCPENHLPTDYDLFRCSNRQDFGIKKWRSTWYPFVYWARVLWWYLAAIVLPPLGLAVYWARIAG